jgi:hypothetical protein
VEQGQADAGRVEERQGDHEGAGERGGDAHDRRRPAQGQGHHRQERQAADGQPASASPV